jgi:thiamine biosynthesis lipoprotein
MTAATRPFAATDRVDLEIWSTTATLVVSDPGVLEPARIELQDVLAEVEATCSRFRPDSEISRILARPGRPAQLSPMLNAVLAQTLRVAAATGYLVDPTVAAAVIAVGYDRDITDVIDRALSGGPVAAGTEPGGAAPGAWRLDHDPAAARLTVPPGVGIDLGATAKSYAADEAAARIASRLGGGVLVGLGGDIAVAGPAPTGGWRIAVADDHRTRVAQHQTVSIASGGLATSSTTTRRWLTATGWRHHIIDPRTGRNPDPRWRTVSVAAASCLDANAAATAAIVLGDAAPGWLTRHGLPALLVDVDGAARPVAGWPRPDGAR